MVTDKKKTKEEKVGGKRTEESTFYIPTNNPILSLYTVLLAIRFPPAISAYGHSLLIC